MMNKAEYILELDALHAPETLRQRLLGLEKPRITMKRIASVAAAVAVFPAVIAGAGIIFLSTLHMGASSPGGGEDVFQSYAGPILPLNIAEGEISAGRQLSMEVTESTYMQVEDTYCFTEDGAAAIALPVASTLDELSGMDAELSLNGEPLGYEVSMGGLLSEDRYAGYTDYQTALSGEPLSGPLFGLQTDLPETVTLYGFEDLPQIPENEEGNPQFGLTGVLPEGSRVLTYGLSGGSSDDEGNVRLSGDLRYESGAEIIVIGEPLENAALRGWEDGGCTIPDEDFSAVLTLSEEDAAETIIRLAADFWEMYSGTDPEDAFCYELYLDACLEELALRLRTFDDPFLSLEDVFVSALHRDRVFYLTVEADLSDGDLLTASYKKAPSRNYGGNADTSLYGYDLLPATENAVTVTGFSASLLLDDRFELYSENFGFTFTGERYEAVLDPAAERYTLVLRKKDD